MSIFSSLDTAVSGLNAQSQAFGSLSNNIANSQTTGYKATDTAFEDFVTNSGTDSAETINNGGANDSDSVVAHTIQRNDVQGTITQSSNALALAISGNGFFNVAQASGNAGNNGPNFSPQQSYTRDGNFSRDANGYFVNPSGQYLDGYAVGANGAVSNTLAPLQVQNPVFTNPDGTANPSVSFQGVAFQSDGSVMANFSNGQSQMVGKIPLATFANVNGLSPGNGQSYTATAASGPATENAVNTGTAGQLQTGATESSTTDLTGDLTQLIVAQQAYGANSKVVSTSNQLLQTTIAMIQ